MSGRHAGGLPRSTLAWVGLAAALSPLLLDLARHWVVEVWALPSAVFAPLLVRLLGSGPGPGVPRRTGALLLALALALELVTVGGGMPRYGRLAIPLGVLGMALWLGRPSPARALVSLWLIPVPKAVQMRLLPSLEALLDRAAAALGLPLGLEDQVLAAPAGLLHVAPADTGLALAGLLAGLGWFAAATTGATVRGAAAAALRWALWALPAQALAWLLVLGLLGLGASPSLARVALSGLVPLAVFAVAAAHLHRRAGAASRAPSLAAPQESTA